VTLEIVQDQSRYIEAAFHEVQLHLILAVSWRRCGHGVHANWRATVISASRSGVHHLDVRHDARAELHVEQHHHAGARLMVGS